MRNGGTPVLVDYLEHILQAVDRIQRYTRGVDYSSFVANEEKQDAVIRNFEIIGEAAANIGRQYPDFAAEHPDFRWQDAYGMRNLLAHGYFKVELGIVWKTALEDLPELRAKVQALLLEVGTDEGR
jgi:uncharacterized protein with HEPN domain